MNLEKRIQLLPIEIVCRIASFLTKDRENIHFLLLQNDNTKEDCQTKCFGRAQVLDTKTLIAKPALSNNINWLASGLSRPRSLFEDVDFGWQTNSVWKIGLRRRANRQHGHRAKRFRYYINIQQIQRYCSEGCAHRARHYRYCSGDTMYESRRRSVYCGSELYIAVLCYLNAISAF
jgi:hypothetical protein